MKRWIDDDWAEEGSNKKIIIKDLQEQLGQGLEFL